MVTSTASMSSNTQRSSLLPMGIVIEAPGPATFFVPGMMSAPPPMAARTGAPNRGCRTAAVCSRSPSMPTIAPLP